MNKFVHVLTAIVLVSTLVACGSEPPPPPPPEPPADNNPPPPPVRNDPDPEPAGPTDAERREALENTLEEMVNFDYDRSELTAEAQSILRAKLPILRNSPTVRIRISGHADERGSTEYNVDLGLRRAQSVRQFLMDSGIDEGRMEIISFGEERPMVRQSNESAWAQNRRAEFAIIAGQVNIND